MYWRQVGERTAEKSCIASLEPIPVVKGGGLSYVELNRIDRFWIRPDRFWESSPTGLVIWPDRFLCSAGISSWGVYICLGRALV
jgi:hypothetical protein